MQAETHPVYTGARDWQDVRDRRCSWCSPWTLDLVDEFKSVEIAACDIDESLMPRSYTKILCPTPTSPAHIKIFFFDGGAATCSANFWKEPKGQQNLVLIGKEIARRGGVDFWTCNGSAESTLKALRARTEIRESRSDPLLLAGGCQNEALILR